MASNTKDGASSGSPEKKKKDGNQTRRKIRALAKDGPKIKAKRKTGPNGGAPRVIFDWTLVDKLCSAQCTGEEIAAYYDCDYETLNSACKRERRMSFSDYFNRKRKVGFVSLRAKRWQRAMEGDTTLMIYLSKALLGETDRVQIQHSGNPNEPVEHVIEMRLEKGDGSSLVIGEQVVDGEG